MSVGVLPRLKETPPDAERIPPMTTKTDLQIQDKFSFGMKPVGVKYLTSPPEAAAGER